MQSTKFHFSSALTPQGWQEDVTVTIGASGIIEGVAAGSKYGYKINGIAIPALANVHSHAHQRFMAGLAEKAGPGAD
ncbi:MAG TPA: formimidoylglutamate deiminase, partial [Aestuariivirga sp.]|nr:formimidoylglutamate deiminase [Aestuariivirga sp.]